MSNQRREQSRGAVALAALLCALVAVGDAGAQSFDFCGCAGSPNSLGNFSSADPSTWPPGTTLVNDFYGGCEDAIRVPLPADGVLVFDSITVVRDARGCNVSLSFVGNAANTAVTLLVKGDVTVQSQGRINASGLRAGDGSSGAAGAPGVGGPGGFAGGEGAYQIVNLGADGGTGVGPGGGVGGVASTHTPPLGGSLLSVPELRPLVGGSGGGGGFSSDGSSGCSAGGGGGGGGGLLVAANGTIDVQTNGIVWADGGVGGTRGSGSCSSQGSGGSGGALRLVAHTIQGGGQILARGGSPGCCGEFGGAGGNPGRIRLEAIANTFSAAGTDPIAVRAPAPGPLVNPIAPSVRITKIDGNATPAQPIGYLNQIDMLVSAPGAIQIDLATTDVPAGTDVEVTVKPKVGGAATSQRVTLASCTAGACAAASSFDLVAGAYIVEARATFQTP
jgi:hypothetical protein